MSETILIDRSTTTAFDLLKTVSQRTILHVMDIEVQPENHHTLVNLLELNHLQNISRPTSI